MFTTLRPAALLLVLQVLALVFAQPPALELTSYQYQNLQVDIPLGWSSQVRDNGSLELTAGGSPDAAELQINVNLLNANLDATQLINAVVTNFEQTQPLSNKQTQTLDANSTVLFTAETQIVDIGAVNLAFAVQFDQAQELTKLIFFAATPADFTRFGGTELVLTVIDSIRPIHTSTTASAAPNVPNTPAIRGLEGSWQTTTQVVNHLYGPIQTAVGGSASVSRLSSQLGAQMAGTNLQLHFQPDGSYQVNYRALVINFPLQSQEDVVEVGSYSLNGNILILTPRQMDREIFVGHQANTQRDRQTNLPPRQYVVAQDTHLMVLYGPCAPYQIEGYCPGEAPFPLERIP